MVGLSQESLRFGEELASITLGIDALDRRLHGTQDVIDGLVVINMGWKDVRPFETYAEARAALAELAKKDYDTDLYVAFTAQEEVGLRGAQTAAFAIQPDYAIAVDVTDTGDMPERKYPMAVKLGAGPAVKIMDRSVICDQSVKQALYAAAEQEHIPVQREIMEFGGTDTGVIQRAAGGVRAGAVSIPTRYIHSPSEMANVRDIEHAIQLIASVICRGWKD